VGNRRAAKKLFRAAQQIPSLDPHDPSYRRLRYVRYADDILLGFAGPRVEAEAIKHQLGQFLRETLHLELSQEKTLITHASTQAARFLGYEIVNQQANDKHDPKGHRSINGRVALRLPADVVEKKRAMYMREGKPVHRSELLLEDDFSIVAQYQSEYRGLVQYYLLAQNVAWLNKLHWVMRGSLLKTLAHKHKTSVSKILRKYKSTVNTPSGPLICLEVRVERGPQQKPLTARFGGIPLRQQKRAILVDYVPMAYKNERNELIKRLTADTCELCGATEQCEVHHIRKLADLKQKGRKEKPVWQQRMAARRRKTLVVCRKCHAAIHHGRAT